MNKTNNKQKTSEIKKEFCGTHTLHCLVGTLNYLLSCCRNFIYCRNNKNTTEDVKERTEEFGIAWMPCEDAARMTCPWWNRNCLNGMINPFPNADKKTAEGEKQSLFVCNAFNIKNKRGYCPCGTEQYKYMIPVIYFKPGEEFVHFDSSN